MSGNLGHLGLQNPGSGSGSGPQGNQGFQGRAGSQGNQGNQGAIPSGTVISYFGQQDWEPTFGVVREGVYGASQPGNDKVRVPIPSACGVDNFVVNVVTNTFNGTTVFTVYKNGVATALTVSYTAGQTGIKTSSGRIAYAANDLFSFAVDTTGSGSGAITAAAGADRVT